MNQISQPEVTTQNIYYSFSAVNIISFIILVIFNSYLVFNVANGSLPILNALIIYWCVPLIGGLFGILRIICAKCNVSTNITIGGQSVDKFSRIKLLSFFVLELILLQLVPFIFFAVIYMFNEQTVALIDQGWLFFRPLVFPLFVFFIQQLYSFIVFLWRGENKYSSPSQQFGGGLVTPLVMNVVTVIVLCGIRFVSINYADILIAGIIAISNVVIYGFPNYITKHVANNLTMNDSRPHTSF